MGIYIQTPGPSKRDWLRENGTPVSGAVMIGTASEVRYVFWQRAPWGENAAVAYDRSEFERLANSRVFEEVYSVPVEKLLSIGVSKLTIGAWS